MDCFVQAAEELQESAWFLRGEELDVVRDRVDRLGARQAELVDWVKGSAVDKEFLKRALDAFDEICRYDLDVMHWLGFEPILTKWVATLRQ